MQSVLYSCQNLIKFDFSRYIFEKLSNVMFHESPSIGNRVLPCGQTDRRPEVSKLIVAFRNLANPSENEYEARCYVLVSDFL